LVQEVQDNIIHDNEYYIISKGGKTAIHLVGHNKMLGTLLPSQQYEVSTHIDLGFA